MPHAYFLLRREGRSIGRRHACADRLCASVYAHCRAAHRHAVRGDCRARATGRDANRDRDRRSGANYDFAACGTLCHRHSGATTHGYRHG